VPADTRFVRLRVRRLSHLEMILGTLRRKPPRSGAKGRATGEDEDDSMTESESEDADSDIVERKVRGWVYVGSHNFTSAAWGGFQAKSTAFSPVFAVSPPQNSREAIGFMLMQL
jgi:hypothetical protein